MNQLKTFEPQKLQWFSNALAIHLVDFPIYYVECLSERHFIIAGGGGSSRTGVHNQINVLELVSNGNLCGADLIMKYQTPEEIPDAIMSGSLMREASVISPRLVASGSNAIMYKLEFSPATKGFQVLTYSKLEDKKIKIEMKCVKCIPGNKILTGGLDGFVYIWDQDNKIERKLKAHSKEIDEIDIDLNSQQIVTLSRDEAKCAVWDLVNLNLLHEFKKEFINNPELNRNPNFKFIYRACKYAYDFNLLNSKKGTAQESYLLIACNPVPAKGPSMIYKLNTKSMTKDIKFTSNVTTDGIMAMTVSSDGRFVGVGTRSGSVNIMEVESLKSIYKIDGAHSNAITNLAFLPSKEESLSLTNSKKCALLSVSIDRRIVLHRPQNKSTIISLLFLFIVAAIIIFISTFLKIYVTESGIEPEN